MLSLITFITWNERNFMPAPKLLLLVGSSLQDQHAGTVLLNEINTAYPDGKICRISYTNNSPSSGSENFWNQAPTLTFSRPPERPVRNRYFRFPRINSVGQHLYIRKMIVPRLVSDAAQFGSENQTDIVWTILDSPTLIYLARRVSSALRLPLIVTIMDPPERFIFDLGMDRWSGKNLLQEFRATLACAERISVASEGMRQEYQNKYGVDSLVLIHGIQREQRIVTPSHPYRSDEFSIGFAGNLYAKEEWRSLLAAIDSVNWRIDGRKIRLRVLSPRLDIRSNLTSNIEYLGWRPVEETIKLLSEVDATYLPYWFDERRRLFVRLCFPNKLSTYLAAGRPVMLHGPIDSSPAHFLKRFPVGVTCPDLTPAAILGSIHELINNPTIYEQALSAGNKAIHEELGIHVFLKRFANFVGMDAL